MEGESAGDSDDVKTLFLEASSRVKGITSKLTEEQLLQFYGLYKQAIEGPCSKPKPGFFQMTERHKWQAWSTLKDMPAEEAMMKYVELLNSVDENWKSAPIQETRSWVHHSSMQNTEEKVPDCDKTVFDWVKEGNLKQMKTSINNETDVNKLDEDGLSLLHWAADRGALDIVKYLVEDCKTDVNFQDGEGQTALHYASFCGHEEVVSYLLHSQADATIEDFDGQSPIDVANSSVIKKMIEAFQKV